MPLPYVGIGILSRNNEGTLPEYLHMIDTLDYPEERLLFVVRTNNNTDDTVAMLREWVIQKRRRSVLVEFDSSNVDAPIDVGATREWTPWRLKVLGGLRNENMQRVARLGADWYFNCDCDNLVHPMTLRILVGTGLPIVAPLIKSDRDPGKEGSRYANFHGTVDENGYFVAGPLYDMVFDQTVKGLIEVPVVHCCYAVRADVVPRLTYDDGSWRMEYVIFSDSARRAGVPQYLDNRHVYGRLTFGSNLSKALEMMGGDK